MVAGQNTSFTTTAAFKLTRSGPIDEPLAVSIEVSDNGVTNNVSYEPVAPTVEFEAGHRTALVIIRPTADAETGLGVTLAVKPGDGVYEVHQSMDSAWAMICHDTYGKAPCGHHYVTEPPHSEIGMGGGASDWQICDQDPGLPQVGVDSYDSESSEFGESSGYVRFWRCADAEGSLQVYYHHEGSDAYQFGAAGGSTDDGFLMYPPEATPGEDYVPFPGAAPPDGRLRSVTFRPGQWEIYLEVTPKADWDRHETVERVSFTLAHPTDSPDDHTYNISQATAHVDIANDRRFEDPVLKLYANADQPAVSADTKGIPYVARAWIGNDLRGDSIYADDITVGWTADANGAAFVDGVSTSTDIGLATNMYDLPGKHAGTKYRASAKLDAMTFEGEEAGLPPQQVVESGEVEVIHGLAHAIEFGASRNELDGNGADEMDVWVKARDAQGNQVDYAQVAWSVEGPGTFVVEGKAALTAEGGITPEDLFQSKMRVRAGSDGGTLRLRAVIDGTEKVQEITVNPMGLQLKEPEVLFFREGTPANTLVIDDGNIAVYTVLARDGQGRRLPTGTLVRWWSSKGTIDETSTVDENGEAKAVLRADAGVRRGGTVRVVASTDVEAVENRSLRLRRPWTFHADAAHRLLVPDARETLLTDAKGNRVKRTPPNKLVTVIRNGVPNAMVRVTIDGLRPEEEGQELQLRAVPGVESALDDDGHLLVRLNAAGEAAVEIDTACFEFPPGIVRQNLEVVVEHLRQEMATEHLVNWLRSKGLEQFANRVEQWLAGHEDTIEALVCREPLLVVNQVAYQHAAEMAADHLMNGLAGLTGDDSDLEGIIADVSLSLTPGLGVLSDIKDFGLELLKGLGFSRTGEKFNGWQALFAAAGIVTEIFPPADWGIDAVRAAGKLLGPKSKVARVLSGWLWEGVTNPAKAQEYLKYKEELQYLFEGALNGATGAAGHAARAMAAAAPPELWKLPEFVEESLLRNVDGEALADFLKLMKRYGSSELNDVLAEVSKKYGRAAASRVANTFTGLGTEVQEFFGRHREAAELAIIGMLGKSAYGKDQLQSIAKWYDQIDPDVLRVLREHGHLPGINGSLLRYLPIEEGGQFRQGSLLREFQAMECVVKQTKELPTSMSFFFTGMKAKRVPGELKWKVNNQLEGDSVVGGGKHIIEAKRNPFEDPNPTKRRMIAEKVLLETVPKAVLAKKNGSQLWFIGTFQLGKVPRDLLAMAKHFGVKVIGREKSGLSNID